MPNALLNTLAAAPVTGTTGGKTNGGGSWFEAMADAWGKTLDTEAGRIEEMSDSISAGNDRPVGRSP